MKQLLTTIGRRLRAGQARGRTLTGGVAALVALPVLVIAAHGDGLPLDRIEMSGGGAWLASPTQGLVTYIDGPSEQVVGSLAAPGARAGDALAVVQSGTSAYVVDSTRGTVARVDGGTYEAGTPIRFADGGGPLSAFVSEAGLYVVDSGRRLASVTDPVTLDVRERLSLAARPGPGQAVMDDAGRLWVVDGNGGLTWFDSDGKHVRPEVGDGRSRLVLVRGQPALVDLSRPRVGRLDDDGSVRSWSCLDVRAGDETELLGSATTDRMYAAVPATGTLVVAGLDGDDCALAVPVGKPGDRFGPLVEASGFVLVPNRSSGRTLVVDLATRAVAADLDLKVRPGARIELLAKDGLVFYNDLDGDKAGVIRFDGRQWTLGKALTKYSRSTTGKGILTSAKETTGPQRPGAGPGAGRPTAPATDPARPSSPAPAPSDGPTPPEPVDPGPVNPGPVDPGPVGPGPGPVDPGGPGPVDPVDPEPVQPKPPVIRSVTWTPRAVVREQPATFTARVDNATEATWRWTILDPATGSPLHEASTAGSMTHTLPAGTPERLQVKLEVTSPAGTAAPVVKPFSTTTSRAPQIASLTVNDDTPAIGQGVAIAAVESVAGPTATWEWTVTGPGEPGTPLQRPAAADFNRVFADAGTYTVTLKVTYDGASDEKSITVTASDTCALTPVTGSPVDVREAAQTVQVRLIDCFEAKTVTVQRADWLSVSAGTISVQPGDTAGVTVSSAGAPPADGVNQGALSFALANGRSASYDVAGNRAPVFNGFKTCLVTGSDQVTFYVGFTDSELARTTVRLVVGSMIRTMQYSDGGGAHGGYHWLEVPRSALPAGSTVYGATARDPYGADGSMGNQPGCW